jgi:hypothetical protein
LGFSRSSPPGHSLIVTRRALWALAIVVSSGRQVAARESSIRPRRIRVAPVLAEPVDRTRWFDLSMDAVTAPTIVQRTRPVRTEGSIFFGAAIAIRPGELSAPLVPSLCVGYHALSWSLPLAGGVFSLR